MTTIGRAPERQSWHCGNVPCLRCWRAHRGFGCSTTRTAARPPLFAKPAPGSLPSVASTCTLRVHGMQRFTAVEVCRRRRRALCVASGSRRRAVTRSRARGGAMTGSTTCVGPVERDSGSDSDPLGRTTSVQAKRCIESPMSSLFTSPPAAWAVGAAGTSRRLGSCICGRSGLELPRRWQSPGAGPDGVRNSDDRGHGRCAETPVLP